MTSLCSIRVEMTKISTEKKPQLFCKKNGFLLSPSIIKEHSCLSKRTYTNTENEEVQVICPHVTTLKAEPYYKEVYQKQPIIVQGEKETIGITPEINFFQKQEENINRLKKAFFELEKERKE